MKKNKMTGKIITCFRLKNSVNGNPRWCFLLQANDTIYELKTQSDSLVGYIFENRKYYEATVEYHITKAGNFICDNITYGVYKGV